MKRLFLFRNVHFMTHSNSSILNFLETNIMKFTKTVLILHFEFKTNKTIKFEPN